MGKSKKIKIVFVDYFYAKSYAYLYVFFKGFKISITRVQDTIGFNPGSGLLFRMGRYNLTEEIRNNFFGNFHPEGRLFTEKKYLLKS